MTVPPHCILEFQANAETPLPTSSGVKAVIDSTGSFAEGFARGINELATGRAGNRESVK
jgi:hypothetical protein